MSECSNVNYSKYFNHILPLSIHSSYSKDLEFSDKIILPRSISKDLLRNKLPFPPQFIIIPDRSFNNSIHCTALEFSSEEDFIYVPFWMLRELGFKAFHLDKGIKRSVKAGYGVTLKTLNIEAYNNSITYTIKKCTYLEIFYAGDIKNDLIKAEIEKYMFVRENSEVSLWINENIVIVKIIKVSPNHIAVIQGDFTFLRLTEMPLKRKAVMEEGTGTENLSTFEKFPIYPERLPKFLIEILKRNELLKTQPKKLSSTTNPYNIKMKTSSHGKNTSNMPIESSNIFQSIMDITDLDKYIPQTKTVEVGKSLEESTTILPPVYNSPVRTRIHSPQLLIITIPELSKNLPTNFKRNVSRFPIWFKQKKKDL